MNIKSEIISITSAILNKIPVIRKYAFTFSNAYIDEYRSFTYNPHKNGEYDLVRVLCRHFVNSIHKNNFVFFDVGANVGSSSIQFVEDFRLETSKRWQETTNKAISVHSFEISPSTYETLSNRTRKYSEIHSCQFGLSSEPGEIDFIDFGSNNGSNTILTSADFHKKPSHLARCKVDTGENYTNRKDISFIDFMKIDTEGAEYFVLKGFDSLLKRKSIGIIQFEYGYTHADAGTLMKDFFCLFNGYGYRVGRLTPEGVQFKEFDYTDNDFKSGPNYVACLPEYTSYLIKFKQTPK